MLDIQNCRLGAACHQRWSLSERISGNPDLRYCPICQSAIHRVDDAAERDDLLRRGKCVAVPARLARGREPCTRAEVGKGDPAPS